VSLKDRSGGQGKRKRTTARDVALRAKCALGTVSRVVNGAPGVSPQTRQRVLDAIEKLGWVPNVAAQSMRGMSSRMVGFIFSDIRNPLYAAMVKGAEDVFSANGFLLVSATSNGDAEREIALIELFRHRHADALLFSITRESDAHVVQAIEASRLPIVMIERDLPIPVDSVGADHLSGTRHATEHLIQLGHHRIAIISGGKGTRVARDRLEGFSQAMRAAGLKPDENLMHLDSFATEYAYRKTQFLLSLDVPPTSILALGMRVLPGVLAAVRARGLSVPSDISLIAGNDSNLAQMTTPPITAIRYDPETLGREAALIILAQLEGSAGAASRKRLEIPTELVLRGSCGPPRAEVNQVEPRHVT
jgi:LacI family transcriptional regulator